MVENAKRLTEDREASLREQINAALSKIRAYARDMEVRAHFDPDLDVHGRAYVVLAPLHSRMPTM
jgi:hypothetical protein